MERQAGASRSPSILAGRLRRAQLQVCDGPRDTPASKRSATGPSRAARRPGAGARPPRPPRRDGVRASSRSMAAASAAASPLRHEQARVPVAHDGADAARRGGHERRPRRQRLHDHVGQAVDVSGRVANRRHDRHVRRRQIARHGVLRDESREIEPCPPTPTARTRASSSWRRSPSPARSTTRPGMSPGQPSARRPSGARIPSCARNDRRRRRAAYRRRGRARARTAVRVRGSGLNRAASTPYGTTSVRPASAPSAMARPAEIGAARRDPAGASERQAAPRRRRPRSARRRTRRTRGG